MTNADEPQLEKAVLAVHGGLAWPRETLDDQDELAVRAAIRASLLAGYEELNRGSVEAVIAAVRVLEDDPLFNAGRGSVFNQVGAIQLDAAIMAGGARRSGAVAAVTRVRNPICAANELMQGSGPVFIVGEDGDRFAAAHGCQMVDPSYFRTDRRWRDYEAWRDAQASGGTARQAAVASSVSQGTVGAVALDSQGNLAAATSTGGVSYKTPGRVGDSAVIGAGTFADNRTCAVSATGQGELFIRTTAASSVSARMMYRGQALAESASEAIDDIRQLGGEGGIIAIDKFGNVAMPFHASGMYRGAINAHGELFVALFLTEFKTCRACTMKVRMAFWVVAVVSLFSMQEFAAAKSPNTKLPDASPALADYIKRPDASYSWRVRQRGKQGSGEFAELILTSQTWHDIVWKHQLFIYRPAKVNEAKQALLLIDGGSWSDSLEKEPNKSKPDSLPEKVLLVTMLADMMQTPIVVLRQVPEQPLFDGKKEDQIIALTFAKYFETGESDWPLLLPMVKAAIRGMDAAQEFAKQEWQLPIEHFTVTGASKRGWTTWLTAASDPRVNALAPMVINMLNMAAHDQLQLESFGKYSDQIRDYTERGLQQMLFTEAGKSLRAIVDPIAYRAQLKQPKLIILATNDAYWPVDALNLYWDDLEGDKYLLYVPNNGHGITDYPRVTAAVAALQKSVTGGKAMPKLSWKQEKEGDGLQFKLTSDVAPTAVRKWTASADTRDFRKAVWKSTKVAAKGDGGREFVADLETPKSGCEAYFLEAEFPGEPVPFVLTTTLHVVGTPATKTAAGGGDSN